MKQTFSSVVIAIAMLFSALLMTGCEKNKIDSPVADHLYLAEFEDGSNETVYLYADGSAELTQNPVAGDSKLHKHLHWTEENNTVEILYDEHNTWQQSLWNTPVMRGKFGYYDYTDQMLFDPTAIKDPNHEYGMAIKFTYVGSGNSALYMLIQ